MDQQTVSTDHTLADSASGRLNGYVHACRVVEHSMYYAACLNRINVIAASERVPQDWEPCKQACRTRSCAAQKMREEEQTAGKALFFTPRGLVATVIEKARAWVDTWNKPKASKPARGQAAPSLIGALSSASTATYADLFSAPEAPAKPSKPLGPPIKALPGETPLQMARRLAAARRTEVVS